MYEGQLEAAAAVRGSLAAIANAVEDAVPALQRGGRIVYVGAGTSGRIGVQDGAELTPTFDWPADRVVFAMAGGLNALTRSAEDAEDNRSAGARPWQTKVGANDVVIGIAASGTTRYDRRLARGHSFGRSHDRRRQQRRRSAVQGRAPSHSGRHGERGHRRLNPHEGGTAQKIVLNLFPTARW